MTNNNTARYWLTRCEALIAKHSTPPRTRGKYKGHGDTDAVAWVQELTKEVQRYIRTKHKGKGYDENMALAAQLGLILFAWYANVHRAKCYDPNRILSDRRKALRRLNKWRAVMFQSMTEDTLMSKVWSGQQFNPPFGRGARGGKFR